MRSEQYKNRRTEKNGKKIVALVIAILYLLSAAIFTYTLFDLNMFPVKFMIIVVSAIVIISGLIVFFMLRGKTKGGVRTILMVLSLVLLFCFVLGSLYMIKAINFMDDLSGDEEKSVSYHILCREDAYTIETSEDATEEKTSFIDKINNIFNKEDEETGDVDLGDIAYTDDINDIVDITDGMVIGTTYSNLDTFKEAKDILLDNLNIDYDYGVDEKDLYDKLLNGEYDLIFISDTAYNIILSEETDMELMTDKLYTVKIVVETEEEVSTIDVSTDSFNILVSGSDFSGSFSSDSIYRSDVNMIITVNPVTHQVHLTSIPRDYYVKLHSYGEYDKLTHASMAGIDELKWTIEDVFNINIDYVLRVNFDALTALVDAMGGIDIYSEYAFTAQGIYFSEGYNHVNGEEALAFARERYSFSNGDMQRIRDQQIVIEGIINKATQSTTILSNYTDILEALGSRIVFDMSRDDMATLIKNQLETMPSWEITKYSISSTTGGEICYFAKYYGALSIVYQNEEANEEARSLILEIMDNR